MNLLIVESGTKASKLSKALNGGRSWMVVSTNGQVMEIPVRSASGQGDFGVRITGGKLELDWEVTDRGQQRLDRLRNAIGAVHKYGGRVYIGTDPDREGEALAAHLIRELRLPKQTPRVLFHSMDTSAVEKSLGSPTVLDDGVVAAQEARRGLDRVVGFGLTQRLHRGVGRVQAPVLKACADQHQACEEFKPGTRYRPGFMVNETFFRLPSEPLPNQAEALKAARTNPARKIMTRKQVKRRVPPPPAVTTADVLKTFSDQAGLDATMKVMQSLYTDGLITYPRTDSRRLHQDWVEKARTHLGSYAGKGQSFGGRANQLAQEAHEGIRPTATDPNLPDGLKKRSGLERGVYVFIARRAFGACMRPAEETVLSLVLDNHATAQLVREDSDGWRRYEPNRRKQPPVLPKPPDAVVWALKEGDAVQAVSAASAVTDKPPPLPTVAWLIDWMECNGVGRPSTFRYCIDGLLSHGYIVEVSGHLVPTDAGHALLDALRESAQQILVPQFTKDMEQRLDEIACNHAGPRASAELVQAGIHLAAGRSGDSGGMQASVR